MPTRPRRAARPARRAAPAVLAVLAALVLGACASEEDRASGSARSTAIAITVAGGRVDPEPGRVEVARGGTLRLTVTSDVADELHVHGLGDPEVELRPGAPVTLELTADQPGLYEVETHESHLLLTQILVR